MNQRGRKPLGRRRTEVFPLNFTPAEKKWLKLKALETDQSMVRFVRFHLFQNGWEKELRILEQRYEFNGMSTTAMPARI